MKRHPALRNFSEQHHHGLVAARRLRLAALGDAPLGEAVAQFMVARHDEIQPHLSRRRGRLVPRICAGCAVG
jgi:hypothetical protein